MLGTALYWILLRFYKLLIISAALFNPKARKWLQGRKHLFQYIQAQLQNAHRPRAWFHCASLGEFEQARPVIERFKQLFPDFDIVLTFFSPSGYEAKKQKCALAQYIFYLPLDSPYNARRFVELIKPKIAFFSKYEFWFFILQNLRRQQIPTVLFSAKFTPNQLFFKKIGAWYRQMLRMFTHIFVQDQQSAQLLRQFGINNVTVAGDTRLDRVLQLARSNIEHQELFLQFVRNHRTIVAGSTYLPDAKILAHFINLNPDVKLIIAPHELDQHSLAETCRLFDNKYLLYTDLVKGKAAADKQVLVIDTLGLLSRIYRFATFAYVGGGFGKGIHNILEAAVYGKPVVFGPNYRKFKEAVDLVQLGAAFPISKPEDFPQLAEKLLTHDRLLEKIRQITSEYIAQHAGATEKIIAKVSQLLSTQV